ncbi:hypothetical protein LINPERPRIM_LOCUS18152, partial [Linum perenne]
MILASPAAAPWLPERKRTVSYSGEDFRSCSGSGIWERNEREVGVVDKVRKE